MKEIPLNMVQPGFYWARFDKEENSLIEVVWVGNFVDERKNQIYEVLVHGQIESYPLNNFLFFERLEKPAG